MVQLSSNLLFISFFLYLASTILFAVSLTGRKWRDKSGEERGNRWGMYGFIAAIFGFLFAMGYFIVRWIAAGHAPVSNMFEYGTFLGIMIGLAFVILYAIYRTNILGLFTMPTVMLLIAFASVFPQEVTPLIPALQSVWLKIHVITTALGQGILAIGFAAGLIYLVRTLDFKEKNKQTRAVEFIFYLLLTVFGFVLISYTFNALNYETTFTNVQEKAHAEETMTYTVPALVGPSGGQLPDDHTGIRPIFYAPDWLKAKDLNTVIWSFLSGLVLYVLIRLIFRRRIGAILQPLVRGLSPQMIDELSYRAIAIGFPIFSLGALVFAMIWAQIAWTRFWGWDPKEVWALITFLFYAAYLHLRLSRGWIGTRSAWLGVIGFAIIMFNYVFVNLVIAGLHSYAL